MPSVVTANRLTDGIVVYLATDGSWTEVIGHARRAETEDGVKAEYANGVLEVHVAKPEQPKPRKIQIATGSPEQKTIEGTAQRT